jgi:hypothetical protein
MPAGSSRVERFDPLRFPGPFETVDKCEAEETRVIELTHEQIVLRRGLRGMKMSVRLPLCAFLGVAIRMEVAEVDSPRRIAVVLEHSEPALSVTLCRAGEDNDIVAEWQHWGRRLAMPLLVAEPDGRLRALASGTAGVRVGNPIARRRRRGPLAGRRPTMPLRRARACPIVSAHVHRGEREIIARN